MKEASREGCAVTEAELAEHHYKLGRILWTMGGAMRDDPTMARAHFEAASKEECDSQVLLPPPLLLRSWCKVYTTRFARKTCGRKAQTAKVGLPVGLTFAFSL